MRFQPCVVRGLLAGQHGDITERRAAPGGAQGEDVPAFMVVGPSPAPSRHPEPDQRPAVELRVGVGDFDVFEGEEIVDRREAVCGVQVGEEELRDDRQVATIVGLSGDGGQHFAGRISSSRAWSSASA